MNSYIMLLIVREWFCLNVLWKVKSSHEKKFMMKRSLWWKEKLFFKDKSFWSLLCFKDKESDENVLVFCKDKASDESTSLC